MNLPWETLVFLAPLVSAALLLAGIAFGGGEDGGKDFGGDAEADLEHGHDAGHALDGSHATVPSPLAFLGIGQVPLGLVVVSLLATFGAAGFVTSSLVGGAASGQAGLLLSIGVASVVALFGTRWVSKFVAKVLPARESYNVRKADLVGRSGKALTEVTATDGFVQLKDHEGNLQQVRARTSGTTIPKGATLLVVDREAQRDTYVVEPFDPEAPAAAGPASTDTSSTPVAGGRSSVAQE